MTSKHHEGNGQVDKQRQVTSQYIGKKGQDLLNKTATFFFFVFLRRLMVAYGLCLISSGILEWNYYGYISKFRVETR